jgi:dipeptidase
MKLFKIYLILLTSYFLLLTSDLFSCFAIIAGKNATYDGSVMVSHAEQNGPPAFLNFIIVPPMKHDPNSFVKFANGGIYPEPAESYSYIWSENFGLKGSDAIMNQWGVMCVSDATRTNENSPEELEKRGEITNGGITLELRIEIAKRAKTARQAIHIAADLISKFGYYGNGGTHIIADPNEAWLLTVMAGKHWIAARVPDDKVVILPNVNVIREVNLKDTLNFLASPDIIDYAIKRGWYNPKSGKPFDFKKAYDKKPDDKFALQYGCDARQWRGQCLVTGKNIVLPVKEEGLPFSVTPSHKLTVMDMRAILSDHMEGTEFDLSNKPASSNFQLPASSLYLCNPPKDISLQELYKNYNYANGSPHKVMKTIDGMICNKDLQEIGIFQLRSWLPAEIGCVYWRTTAAPCSSVLTPWYLGITETPEAYHKDYKIEDNVKYDFHFNPPHGTFDYDADKAFWIYNSIENMVDENYGKYIGRVRKVFDKIENDEISIQPEIENTALSLYKKNKDEAKGFLTIYSNGIALKALDNAKKLEKELKTETLGY